uniref:Transposon TX1 uncharacterized n=1 Tax=Cajanus cajan TaxID=3821 RepID=A0A151RWH3_CAJCA|nr:Transposon TX1 uncharacterized [Cajanus cajan]
MLVVKVLGKKVSFCTLENKLQRCWTKGGPISIIDMPEDFYLIKFSKEDYQFALFEGPWLVIDHYLIVQRWRPFFLTHAKKVQKVAVWIRIPRMPIELYNSRFLTRVGNILGTMLKIDKLTSIQSRGKFARICVEMDLHAHYQPTLWLKVILYSIFLEYEGLHSICFKCGTYGHKKEQCNLGPTIPSSGPTMTSTMKSNAAPMNAVERIRNNIGGKNPQQKNPTVGLEKGKNTKKPNIKALARAKNMVPQPVDPTKVERLQTSLEIISVKVNEEREKAKERDRDMVRLMSILTKQNGFSEIGIPSVYGSPQVNNHTLLWKQLINIATLIQGPWGVVGDFNSVLYPHEREGSPCHSLPTLQRNLWKDLETILFQEELLWYQKSRSKWLTFGDRNTHFFHCSTIIRRRKNHILSIQDTNGSWVYTKDNLESMVTNFYRDLFSSDGGYQPLPLSNLFPKLNEVQLQELSKEVCSYEIRRTLLSMGNFKAPGEDDLHAAFYKHQWDVVGSSLCQHVQDCFKDPTKIKSINKTLICLVPKIDHPINLLHF